MKASYQHNTFTLKQLQTWAGAYLKVYDEASDCILFHSRIFSRYPDKGINRVGAPFFFFFLPFFTASTCHARRGLKLKATKSDIATQLKIL